MKEVDYIKVSNLAKARSAEMIIRDMLSGDEYGIDNDKYLQVVKIINEITDRLFGEVRIEVE